MYPNRLHAHRDLTTPPFETANAVLPGDADSVAWLIEQLELDSGLPADRARIRRAFEEAAAAWPGTTTGEWWKWLVEGGHSLGLKGRVLDCTFDQLREAVGDGARVLFRVEPHGGWGALFAARGRKYGLIQPSSEPNRRWVSSRELRHELGEARPEGTYRCVVIEPHLSGAVAPEDHADHPTPLVRAWALLSPEASDIGVLVLYALVSGLLALATPLAIEALVGTVAFGRLLQPIVVLSLMLLVFLAFRAAIKGLQTYVVEIIQRRLFARVAADLAFRLPRARLDAFPGTPGRELLNRFFEIVTVQKVSAQFLLEGISVVLNTLIGMLVLGFYHPWLLGFDIVLLLMIAFAIFVLGRGAVHTSIRESAAKYRMAAWLEDLAACPLAFRHDGAAEFALERADRITFEYLDARRRHFRILLRQIVFALALQALASTALLGLGGWLVVSGQLTLGQLVAAELIVTVIVGSFAKLGKYMEGYYDLMAAVDKLGHLFDLPVEKQDGLLQPTPDRPSEVVLTGVSGRDAAGRGVLHDFTLTIRSGERISLESGTAASTVLDLIYGLRPSLSGFVAIDGDDARDLRPDVLRRRVNLIREIEVFEGTIAENIHLERPDVTAHDVRQALTDVGLLDDVLAHPAGLETPLRSTGDPLTPKQLRLLMLARGIVGRPTLLLIDGLLDALPDAHAAAVLGMLTDPARPWTLVVATGRESIRARSGRHVPCAAWNRADFDEHAGHLGVRHVP
jgi:putative ABC transport system ATP-binding protein